MKKNCSVFFCFAFLVRLAVETLMGIDPGRVILAEDMLPLSFADASVNEQTPSQSIASQSKESGAKKLPTELPPGENEISEGTTAEKGKSFEETSLEKQVIRSMVFLLIVVIMLIAIRILATRRFKDSQRRYYINRSLSIFTVFVVIIGLLVIFVRDLSHLITGMGVAAVGLAIALQETVTAFCGWFVIQGSKGYRIGDWIRVGEHYGEVVDISLLVTVLSEVTPLESKESSGGSWTGGLTGFLMLLFSKCLTSIIRKVTLISGAVLIIRLPMRVIGGRPRI